MPQAHAHARSLWHPRTHLDSQGVTWWPAGRPTAATAAEPAPEEEEWDDGTSPVSDREDDRDAPATPKPARRTACGRRTSKTARRRRHAQQRLRCPPGTQARQEGRCCCCCRRRRATHAAGRPPAGPSRRFPGRSNAAVAAGAAAARPQGCGSRAVSPILRLQPLQSSNCRPRHPVSRCASL